jgi:hypothetical protein
LLLNSGIEIERKGGEYIQKGLKYTTYFKLIKQFKGKFKKRINLNSMMHGLALLLRMLVKDFTITLE